MIRGSCAFSTCPKLAALTSVVIPPGSNWVVLKMLKNSIRNSSFMLSVKLVVFASEKSQFLMAGPRKILRPAFPCVPIVGDANVLGSNHWLVALVFGFSYFTGPTTFGTSQQANPGVQ